MKRYPMENKLGSEKQYVHYFGFLITGLKTNDIGLQIETG